MNSVGYIYDPLFLEHETPAGHPERKKRLLAINKQLKKTGLWERLVHISPRKAARDDLISVHSTDYVNSILGKTMPGFLDGGDTYFSEGTLNASLLAAGAVLTAVDSFLNNRVGRCFCSVRPPGHHAESNRSMGFCIFNNVAVGARYAQEKGFKRVFIIDFDVHHGNGTEHIFEEDPSIFYFSTHQYPHYPGTGSENSTGINAGKGFNKNIQMVAGSGDEEYLHVYHKILPELIRKFKPSILMVSAGYDIHIQDSLSEIRVTTAAIGGMIEGILGAIPGLPAIFCLEGGYNLEGLSSAVVQTIEKMFTT